MKNSLKFLASSLLLASTLIGCGDLDVIPVRYASEDVLVHTVQAPGGDPMYVIGDPQEIQVECISASSVCEASSPSSLSPAKSSQ